MKESINSGWEDQRYLFMDHVLGDCSIAAIYGPPHMRSRITSAEFSLREISEAFTNHRVNPNALFDFFYGDNGCFFDKIYRPLRVSLQALATAAEIYRMLPNSTVLLDITSQSLHQSRWLANFQKELMSNDTPFTLDRPSTFACIASFESESVQFSSEGLEQVMALSARNSIYVAAALLCDPAVVSKAHEIRRIEGNIGKAGIAMLIPPKVPMISQLETNTWDLVNHIAFDGKLENCFESTTLHLSFTEYILPIDMGVRGGRDHEAFFIETLISVHDRGHWVADLDVLGALKSELLWWPSYPEKCQHSGAKRTFGAQKPIVRLASIDSWAELLDRPMNAEIVRAYQNKFARLAAMTMSIQKGYKTMIIPDDICWGCVRDTGWTHHPIMIC